MTTYEVTKYSKDELKSIVREKVIVILTASTKEFESISSFITPLKNLDFIFECDIDGVRNLLGSINNYVVLLIKTQDQGSLRVNSCMNIIHKLHEFIDIEISFSVGICYGINRKLKRGDVVISAYVYQYETADVREEGVKRLARPNIDSSCEHFFTLMSKSLDFRGFGICYGRMVSGEKFINSLDFKKTIENDYSDAVAGDMESSGISSASLSIGKKWCIIKSVSDFATGDKDKTNEREVGYADNSACVLNKILLSDEFQEFCNCKSSTDYYELVETSNERHIIPYNNLNLEGLVKFEFPRAMTNIHEEKNSQNKRHYEYALVNYPCSSDTGILLLGKSIRIRHSLEHFIENYRLPNSYLKIFTPRVVSRKTGKSDFRVSEIDKLKFLFSDKKNLNVSCHFIEDYIWEKSEQRSMKKGKNELHTTKYYVDQPLYCFSDEKNSILHSTIDKMCDMLLTFAPLPSPIIAITGDAGIGKSTFCKQLVNKINSTDSNIQSIYLSNEANEWTSPEKPVVSIYDLYRYIFRFDDEENIIDKDAFVLNVLCGNIVLVIDGIDEISSALGINFDLKKFIDSINELNKAYSQCKIVLAFRRYYVDHIKYVDGIIIYELNGFNSKSVNLFFKKKLKEYSSVEFDKYSTEALSLLKSFTKDGPWNPLYADISVEVAIRDVDIFVQYNCGKYLNLDHPIDRLIVKLITRENKKQNINATVDEILDLLLNICVTHNGRIKYEEISDSIKIVILKYINATGSDIEKFLQSPFLKKENNVYLFKYTQINDMLRVRLLKYLLENNYSADPRLRDILIGMSYRDSDVLSLAMVEKLCASSSVVNTLNNVYRSAIRKESIDINDRRMLSGVALLAAYTSNAQTKSDRAKIFIDIFSSDMHFFSVFTNIPALDFSNIRIHDGVLSDCIDIFKSEFPQKKCFFNTKVSLPEKAKIKIPHYVFDVDCVLNSSVKACIDRHKISTCNAIENIKKDISSIFRAFYINSSFLKISKNKISRQLSTLSGPNSINEMLKKLLELEWIEKEQKDNDELFIIKTKYRDDIQRFLTEGNMTRSLSKLINDLV